MVTRWPEMPLPPLPSKPSERINHTSLLPHRGRPRRVSTLTGRLTTTSSFAGPTGNKPTHIRERGCRGCASMRPRGQRIRVGPTRMVTYRYRIEREYRRTGCRHDDCQVHGHSTKAADQLVRQVQTILASLLAIPGTASKTDRR